MSIRSKLNSLKIRIKSGLRALKCKAGGHLEERGVILGAIKAPRQRAGLGTLKETKVTSYLVTELINAPVP